VATVAGLACLALLPAVAQAGVGAGAVPTFPTAATVGDTGLAASIELGNFNSGADSGSTNTVCNAGDAIPCPAGAPGITLIPSCGQLGDFSSCMVADPGVFRISSTGTGVAGTACVGIVFDITLIDVTFGRLRFTPQGGAHVTLPGAGSVCRVAVTFDVLKMPTVDQNPAPGVQTVQVTDNTQRSGDITASARGTSAGTTVTRATPAIATTASGNIDLGGQVTDTAIVSGRVSPVAGATVDFRLYGPGDATCSGTPVFESLGRPLSAGGTATSAPFTPTAVGTYHWRAFYSGDANNVPVSGACNEANENVTVSAPPSTPPGTPPTTPETPTTPTGTPSKPGIQVLGVRARGCAGLNFRLRVRTAAVGLKRVRVTLDGRTIARSKHSSFTVRIGTAGLRRGRHVLSVIATSAAGHTTRTVSFKRCGAPVLPRFVG
jgi:hypothetical protein